MTATEDRVLALPSGDGAPRRPMGALARPRSATGWRSWVSTVDHKKIGIMYGAASLFFFCIGGLEALLIRLQLAVPDGKLLSADLYNQVYTMHGTTMIFLVVMPLGAAFMNYLVPLQIGARDVAFPRLNAFGFWCYFSGGIILNSSWLLGNAPDGGWFNYAPNNGVLYSPSHGIDFWNMGLLITGIASLTGAVNLIVTILNLRAPGMTLFKMPVFTWMTLVTQFMLLFAIPVLTSAQFLLMFDRLFDSRFFDVEAGADPLLWQHLFWIFGHPEVYIMILPAFGLVSEVLPVFSRKPIFGYPFMVFSGIAIGFLGWGVWAHHMFASGIGEYAVAAFSMATMLIAVPTGIKIFNWVFTMWGGKVSLTAPMLYAIGMVSMFTIGGLSGVTHAVSPSDTQQTDTYYIVAHFHYVLFGGALFIFVGAFYYYWPKVFGYFLSELWGKVNFWMLFVGFNLTFGPMHILGLWGQPRRIYTYRSGYGFDLWNMVSTIGAVIIGITFISLFANIFVDYRKAKKAAGGGRLTAPPDPWDARNPEWLTANPTPAHNFDEIPEFTHGIDELWYRKYEEGDDHRLVRVRTAEEVVEAGTRTDVHLPAPSYWPLVLASGLPFIGWGLIYNLWLCLLGGALVVAGIYGWVLEPSDDLDDPEPGEPGDHPTPGEPTATEQEAALVD